MDEMAIDDREAFFASLALWNRPEAEMREKILPAGTDVDAYVDQMFREM